MTLYFMPIVFDPYYSFFDELVRKNPKLLEMQDDLTGPNEGERIDGQNKTLKLYNKIVYNKKLPNGEMFYDAINKRGIHLSNDSFIVSYRHKDMRQTLLNAKLEATKNDANFNWLSTIDDFLSKTYTIGGEMIFPSNKEKSSINVYKNNKLKDRFDLFLECLQLQYDGKDNPMKDVFDQHMDFFQLFESFEGYVDFFMLQGWVSSNKVNRLLDKEINGIFPRKPNSREYLDFLKNQLELVEKRNNRFKQFIDEHPENLRL